RRAARRRRPEEACAGDEGESHACLRRRRRADPDLASGRCPDNARLECADVSVRRDGQDRSLELWNRHQRRRLQGDLRLMPGNLLTVASTVLCPHGGRALLLTSNTRVLGRDGLVLLESDIHTVVGCPFTVGSKYSPCVRIEWSAPANESSSGEIHPVVETSV